MIVITVPSTNTTNILRSLISCRSAQSYWVIMRTQQIVFRDSRGKITGGFSSFQRSQKTTGIPELESVSRLHGDPGVRQPFTRASCFQLTITMPGPACVLSIAGFSGPGWLQLTSDCRTRDRAFSHWTRVSAVCGMDQDGSGAGVFTSNFSTAPTCTRRRLSSRPRRPGTARL